MVNKISCSIRSYIYDLYLAPIKQERGNVSEFIEKMILQGMENPTEVGNKITQKVSEMHQQLIKMEVKNKTLKEKIITLERQLQEKKKYKLTEMDKIKMMHRGVIKSGLLREI